MVDSDQTQVPVPPLLIVGGHDAGKSHYGAQLLRRLQRRQGELRMVGTPTDLGAFQEVIDQLAAGRSAPHTPSNVFRQGSWLVRSEKTGRQSRLVWPDYAGEQVEDILRLRQLDQAWIQRLRESQGWLLFIRPTSVSKHEFILDRPRAAEFMSEDSSKTSADVTVEAGSHDAEQSSMTFGEEAGIVELLQILLFARQAHSGRKAPAPCLVLVLSCWDELAEGATNTPSDVLRMRLPLVSQFIKANWAPRHRSILGLSALGKPLNDDIADDTFAEEGPERQGWCVLEDGSHSVDLTLPVALLMQHLSQ